MKEKVEKVIFNNLRDLPSNKVFLWPDLQAAFNIATGESLSDHLETVQEVADELEKADYARFHRIPNGLPRITKGLDFDEWGNKVAPTNSGDYQNIGSLNAQNVQVGDGNTMNLN